MLNFLSQNFEITSERILDPEIEELFKQLKLDMPNISEEEFWERQKSIFEKIGLIVEPDRSDLTNGWIEPDGTFNKLQKKNHHDLWAQTKKGVNYRILLYQGWVKVTQWEKDQKCIAMYDRELSPDQKIKIEELNAKPFQINMAEK